MQIGKLNNFYSDIGFSYHFAGTNLKPNFMENRIAYF